ncbi:DNA-binding response regulator, partial [Rhizobium sp. BR5]
MFMGTSDYAAKQGNAVAPINGTLLIIADPDLFSECLTEALGKKFPTFAVVSVASSEKIDDDYG